MIIAWIENDNQICYSNDLNVVPNDKRDKTFIFENI